MFAVSARLKCCVGWCSVLLWGSVLVGLQRGVSVGMVGCGAVGVLLYNSGVLCGCYIGSVWLRWLVVMWLCWLAVLSNEVFGGG